MPAFRIMDTLTMFVQGLDKKERDFTEAESGNEEVHYD